MAGYCKIILIGNLGRDPETRTTTGGTEITNFSIAVTDKVKGEDRTQWYKITAFGKLGEICAQYLRKGKQVFVEGRLQVSDWQDKDGNNRYTLEVIANAMQMLGTKADNGGGYGGGSSAPPAAPAYAGAGNSSPPVYSSGAADSAPGDDDDDQIPF